MSESTTEAVPGGWANQKNYQNNLWKSYKLNMQGFNALWLNQGGLCAGCKRKLAHPLNRSMELACRPEVDHDHATGKVRGILCHRCNILLGKIKDNQELLEALIAYLRRNGDWK